MDKGKEPKQDEKRIENISYNEMKKRFKKIKKENPTLEDNEIYCNYYENIIKQYISNLSKVSDIDLIKIININICYDQNHKNYAKYATSKGCYTTILKSIVEKKCEKLLISLTDELIKRNISIFNDNKDIYNNMLSLSFVENYSIFMFLISLINRKEEQLSLNDYIKYLEYYLIQHYILTNDISNITKYIARLKTFIKINDINKFDAIISNITRKNPEKILFPNINWNDIYNNKEICINLNKIIKKYWETNKEISDVNLINLINMKINKNDKSETLILNEIIKNNCINEFTLITNELISRDISFIIKLNESYYTNNLFNKSNDQNILFKLLMWFLGNDITSDQYINHLMYYIDQFFKLTNDSEYIINYINHIKLIFVDSPDYKDIYNEINRLFPNSSPKKGKTITYSQSTSDNDNDNDGDSDSDQNIKKIENYTKYKINKNNEIYLGKYKNNFAITHSICVKLNKYINDNKLNDNKTTNNDINNMLNQNVVYEYMDNGKPVLIQRLLLFELIISRCFESLYNILNELRKRNMRIPLIYAQIYNINSPYYLHDNIFRLLNIEYYPDIDLIKKYLDKESQQNRKWETQISLIKD